jgi:hypothetical protein
MSGQSFTSFAALGQYLRETSHGEMPASPKNAESPKKVEVPKKVEIPTLIIRESHLTWPNGKPVTGIEVRDHAVQRYRERSFNDQYVPDNAIRNRISSGISRYGCFGWALPGIDIWVMFFGDEAVAASRNQDNKMIVASYFGSKQLMYWHRHQEVKIRGTRKAIAAVMG